MDNSKNVMMKSIKMKMKMKCLYRLIMIFLIKVLKVKLKILHDTNVNLDIDSIDLEDNGDVGISIYSSNTKTYKITYKEIENGVLSMHWMTKCIQMHLILLIMSQKLIYMEANWHCTSTPIYLCFHDIFFGRGVGISSFKDYIWGANASINECCNFFY